MRQVGVTRRWLTRGLVASLLIALVSPATPGQFWKRWFRRPVSNSQPLVVQVLDIGQGDSILIRSPEGRMALIDAGTSKRASELLHEQGITQLDLVAVSHHHTDHYGGMDEVIREFSPRYFLATGTSHVTSMYKKLLADVKAQGMTAVEPTERPRRINLGSVTLTVLPQPPEDEQEENNNSLGIRLEYGDFAMLLTGDSEEAERAWWLVNCPDLLRNCQVLKLAHHGSRNGTDPHWLEVVKPKMAVASLGEGNDYGHPHPETVELLKEYEIPFYRTDQVGTITIRSDGARWEYVRNDAMLASRGKTDDAVRPAANGGPRRGSPSRAAESEAKKVNVNTASRGALESLPGINSTAAKKIIAGRPYQSVEELEEVQGISARTLDQIRPRVRVR